MEILQYLNEDLFGYITQKIHHEDLPILLQVSKYFRKFVLQIRLRDYIKYKKKNLEILKALRRTIDDVVMLRCSIPPDLQHLRNIIPILVNNLRYVKNIIATQNNILEMKVKKTEYIKALKIIFKFCEMDYDIYEIKLAHDWRAVHFNMKEMTLYS